VSESSYGITQKQEEYLKAIIGIKNKQHIKRYVKALQKQHPKGYMGIGTCTEWPCATGEFSTVR
jgi:hypothetical protein